MAAHRSKCAITQVLGNTWFVEDGGLHDARREDYLVASWVVVRLVRVSNHELRRCMQVETTNIDSICGHFPFISVRRLTQSRPIALYGELGNGKSIFEEGRAGNVDVCVVLFQGNRVSDIWALCGIANFLLNVVN